MAHHTRTTTDVPPLELAWREFETALQVEGMAARAEARGLTKARGLYQEAARHHAEALRLQAEALALTEVAA